MKMKKDLLLNADEIKDYCDIPEEDYLVLKDLEGVHTFSTTKYYASLIDFDDPHDPLKKMQLPMNQEHMEVGKEDTSNEKTHTKVKGLQHKYKNTALMLVNDKCAMYCRYCFRKRMVGKGNDEVVEDYEAAFEYIENHPEIDNILLSGGDSLFLSADKIQTILERAFKIKHIRFVRFGSRIPVVYPQRIFNDEKLIKVLKHYGRSGRLHVVTQYNHPRELTEEAKQAIEILRSCNIMVRNQSVLLKGINDDPEVMAELFKKLVDFGVVPYYIYQCRPVKNVKMHFQLPLTEAIKVVEGARKRMNGITKAFRFLMSTYNGKIEVVGHSEDKIFCKYNQASDEENIGRMFTIELDDEIAWVDETTAKEFI